MADSRDITGKNRKFKGTDSIVLPKGTQAQRVSNEGGQIRFNTDTNLAEYYDGSDWKPIDAPPTITSFTLDGGASVTSSVINNTTGGDATIVISGSNFDATSGTVVFEPEGGGSNVTTQTITRTSSSSFTVTVTRADFLEANDPYAIKLTNGSGLAATLAGALDVNIPPTFDQAAGSLGSVYNSTSGTFDGSATDADGDTITYSITAGALPSGLSINSSTGSITGTVSDTATVYTFTVQAATTQYTVTREFSISVLDLPTGGTITTSGNYRIHTFNSSSNFVAGGSVSSIEYLVIAGGGGGGSEFGGGGGAGGFRTNVPGATSGGGASAESSMSITAGTYPVVVGGGGTALNGNHEGREGDASSFNGITSIGGGGGGCQGISSAVRIDGGSGGGPSHNSPGQIGQGTAGQGYNSGPGYNNGPPYANPGGGGAGEIGQTPPNNSTSARGGNGQSSSITGSAVTYAGGGGGGFGGPSYNGTPGAGGSGGGGAGGPSANTNGINAGTNTGGGGGGSHSYSSSQRGGFGGSGKVIIRYDTTTL